MLCSSQRAAEWVWAPGVPEADGSAVRSRLGRLRFVGEVQAQTRLLAARSHCMTAIMWGRGRGGVFDALVAEWVAHRVMVRCCKRGRVEHGHLDRSLLVTTTVRASLESRHQSDASAVHAMRQSSRGAVGDRGVSCFSRVEKGSSIAGQARGHSGAGMAEHQSGGR